MSAANTASQDSKPLSRMNRPDLTRLPRRSLARRVFRTVIRLVSRLVIRLCTQTRVMGLENFPDQGPALIVTNHLGDADAILGAAYFPGWVDALAAVEMYDFPILGKIMDAYGVIWVHRGRPDRRALKACLQALREGRFVALAPEGRESLTGSLEAGTRGAAYLTLKADVPVIPVTFTGTENWRVYGNLKRLRRTAITLTAGSPYCLEALADFRSSLRHGTKVIMESLAQQLPPAYKGVWQEELHERA